MTTGRSLHAFPPTTGPRSGRLRGHLVSALAAGLPVAAMGAYWTMMSPYSQLLGAFPYRATNGTAEIALTFDDGPNEPYTTQIATLLSSRGIRATFFQVASNVEQFPDTTRSLLDAGHVIGNHSYSHRFTKCFTARDIRQEVCRAQDVFATYLHRVPTLYRPPWLVRTPALFEILRSCSLQPVSGTFCHPLEVAQPAASRIAGGAIARTRPGAMIIFHDGYDDKGGNRSSTVAAVAMVIDRLSRDGYRFTTVDRMLGTDPYRRPR
jgi:peptidoglycan/xylan/chitin deacetylase (PgdA/CDA1 family)